MWNQPYLSAGLNLNRRSNSLNSATDLGKQINQMTKRLISILQFFQFEFNHVLFPTLTIIKFYFIFIFLYLFI